MLRLKSHKIYELTRSWRCTMINFSNKLDQIHIMIIIQLYTKCILCITIRRLKLHHNRQCICLALQLMCFILLFMLGLLWIMMFPNFLRKYKCCLESSPHSLHTGTWKGFFLKVMERFGRTSMFRSMGCFLYRLLFIRICERTTIWSRGTTKEWCGLETKPPTRFSWLHSH